MILRGASHIVPGRFATYLSKVCHFQLFDGGARIPFSVCARRIMRHHRVGVKI
jgi:hypothetical protein